MSEAGLTPHIGDVVVDRYRLDAVLDNTDPWAELWLGEDTVLQRPVAVRLLSPDDDRTPGLLDAARATAALDDARCVRVLDMAAPRPDGSAPGYIVRTWVEGTTLGDLVVEAPLSAIEAADLVADVADAIALAHDTGLVHGALDPHRVMLTPGGEVAIVDLAIADALRAPPRQATDIHDVRALGALLYACLTARWPGPDPCVLDAATTVASDGGTMKPLAPRRARAGVPQALDALCRRAMGERVGNDEPFTDARSLSIALRRWVSGEGASNSALVARRAATGSGEPRDALPLAGSRAIRWFVALIIVALLVGAIIIGVQVLDVALSEPDGSPPPGPVSTSAP